MYHCCTQFDTQKVETPRSLATRRVSRRCVGWGFQIHPAPCRDYLTPACSLHVRYRGPLHGLVCPDPSPGSSARGYWPRARDVPTGQPESRETRPGGRRAPARERVCGAPGWVLRPEATDRPTDGHRHARERHQSAAVQRSRVSLSLRSLPLSLRSDKSPGRRSLAGVFVFVFQAKFISCLGTAQRLGAVRYP